jgi:hypothetical protein
MFRCLEFGLARSAIRRRFRRLAEAGLKAHVVIETVEFAFDDFASTWDVLAAVTAAGGSG